MKIKIELSEMEGMARNKVLYEIDTLLDINLLSTFMTNTDISVNGKFGSLLNEEELLYIYLNEKCCIEGVEVLNLIIKQFLAALVYFNELRDSSEDLLQQLKNKWGIDYENKIRIIEK